MSIFKRMFGRRLRTECERDHFEELTYYAQHLMRCRKWGPTATAGDRCTCGLDEVIGAYRSERAELLSSEAA